MAGLVEACTVVLEEVEDEEDDEEDDEEEEDPPPPLPCPSPASVLMAEGAEPP